MDLKCEFVTHSFSPDASESGTIRNESQKGRKFPLCYPACIYLAWFLVSHTHKAVKNTVVGGLATNQCRLGWASCCRKQPVWPQFWWRGRAKDMSIYALHMQPPFETAEISAGPIWLLDSNPTLRCSGYSPGTIALSWSPEPVVTQLSRQGLRTYPVSSKGKNWTTESLYSP